MSVLTSGLISSIDLIEITAADSGYGTVGTTETTVASAVSARFTTLNGMQEDFDQGRGADNIWKVVAHVDLIQDRLLEHTSTFQIEDNTTNIRYRVLKAKAQIDELGNQHHVSLVVRQDRA